MSLRTLLICLVSTIPLVCASVAEGAGKTETPLIAKRIQLAASWQVIGPLPLGKDPFRTQYPPEKKVDLKQKLDGRKGPVAWQARAEDGNGTVWLHKDLGEDFIAYASAEFEWKEEKKGYLFIGSDDGIVVWLNGKKVWEKNVLRAMLPGEDRALVEFAEGKNRILIKLVQRMGDAGFNVRAVPADQARLDPALRSEMLLDAAKRDVHDGNPWKALAALEDPMRTMPCGGGHRDLFNELCAGYGSLARTAEAFEAQAKFHTGRGRTYMLDHAARLYIQAEDPRSAARPVDAIEKESKKPAEGLRRDIGLAEHRVSVLLPESMGTGDTLAFIGNTVNSGAHAEAAAAFRGQLEALRDTVVLLDDGTGRSTPGYLKAASRKWPAEFHEELTRLAEKEAKTQLASAARTGPSTEAMVWELYGESGSARAMARRRAAGLLASGRAPRAALWYLELAKRTGSPGDEAGAAFSLAAAGYGGILKGFTAALSDEQKKAAVSVGGRKTTLLAAITGFEKELTGKRDPGPDRPTEAWSRYLSLGAAARGLAAIRADGRGDIVPVTSVPGCDGNRLIVNTGTAVRAFDLNTGEPLWICRPYPVSRWNYDYASPSMPVPVLGAAAYAGTVFVRVAPSLSTEGIVRETVLHAVDASTGRIVWNLTEVAGLEGHIAVSEPLIAYGTLYVAALRRGAAAMTLSAAALDPETGALRWKRTLVSGSETFGGERIAAELPRPLLSPGGVVFVTHMGVVTVTNPLTGEIERLTRYERRAAGRRPGSRYHVNPVLYSDGVIVAAPRDSDCVLGMDGASGKIVWSADRTRTPCLAGAGNGAVYLVGAARVQKLDITTGKPPAAAAVRAAGLLPVCYLTGNRLVVGALDVSRAFDAATLQPRPTPGEDPSFRVLMTDGCAVSISKDSVITVGPEEGKPSPSASPAPVQPPSLQARPLPPAPSGHRPVLRWHIRNALENLCVPEEYRGAFLSWNRYEMKLHDLNGFGQVLWERAVPGAAKVMWSSDRLAIATPGRVYGLDGRTGRDTWKHRCGDGDPHLTRVNGAFCFLGPGSRTVLCVDAATGRVRWESEIPPDLTAVTIADSGSGLYLVGRNIQAPRPWDVRTLDPKSGGIGKLYSRKLTHYAEKFAGIYGGNVVWTLGTTGWAEALKDGAKKWEVKSTRWSLVPRLVEDGEKRLLFMDVDRGNDVVLDPATGTTIIARNEGRGLREFHAHRGDCYLWSFTKRISPRFIRVKPDGGEGKNLWEYQANPWDWGWRHALSVRGDSVRAAWKYDRWLLIADLDRKSGKPLRSPVMMRVPGIGKLTWRYDGNVLLVGNPEGLRCFTMTDPKTDVSKWAAARRASAGKLRDPQSRTDALAAVRIGAAMLDTLDVSWLAVKRPLVLDGEWFWFPARERELGYRDGDWGGKDDLSVKLAVTPKRYAGTVVKIEIRDDHWEPFDGERGGDYVTIRAGHVDVAFGAGPDGKVRWKQKDGRNIFGKNVPTVSFTDEGRTYTLIVDGRMLSLQWHNMDTVTVIDDDGGGPKGGMEWGTRFYRKSK